MKCPICKTSVPDEPANRPRTYPFCCDRCKLIDLGRWLNGTYRVPVDSPAQIPQNDRAARSDD